MNTSQRQKEDKTSNANFEFRILELPVTDWLFVFLITLTYLYAKIFIGLKNSYHMRITPLSPITAIFLCPY